MLGIGVWGLAQRGLAQIPIVGVAAAVGPAWRRWLAQRCVDESLNRPADNAAVRNVIGYMLAEACELWPDAPRDFDALREFLPPDTGWEDSEDALERLAGILASDDEEAIAALLFASVDALPLAQVEWDEDDKVIAELLLGSMH